MNFLTIIQVSSILKFIQKNQIIFIYSMKRTRQDLSEYIYGFLKFLSFESILADVKVMFRLSKGY